MYMYMYVYMYVCVYIYIYIYIIFTCIYADIINITSSIINIMFIINIIRCPRQKARMNCSAQEESSWGNATLAAAQKSSAEGVGVSECSMITVV